MERDKWMTAEEAVQYGLIDKVLYPADWDKMQNNTNPKKKKK